MPSLQAPTATARLHAGVALSLPSSVQTSDACSRSTGGGAGLGAALAAAWLSSTIEASWMMLPSPLWQTPSSMRQCLLAFSVHEWLEGVRHSGKSSSCAAASGYGSSTSGPPPRAHTRTHCQTMFALTNCCLSFRYSYMGLTRQHRNPMREHPTGTRSSSSRKRTHMQRRHAHSTPQHNSLRL
jgi:hypothetical protein